MLSREEHWTMARARGKQKGTVRIEGGSWIGYWKEWVADPTDPEMKRGRWKQQSRRVGDSKLGKKAAQKILESEVLDGLSRYVKHPGSAMTLTQFWEFKYVPLLLKKKAKNTRIQYASMMKNHIIGTPEKPGPLRNVTLRDCGLEVLQTLINNCGAAGLSWQTCTHIKHVIQAVLKYARAVGDLPNDGAVNPASQVDCGEMKRVAPNEAYAWETSQRILAALKEKSLREYTSVLLSMLTTMGQAELLGLHWKHVNMTMESTRVDGEIIYPLRAAVRYDWTCGELRAVKRKKRRRQVPLPEQILEALAEWKAQSKFTEPGHPVFCNREGGYLDGHNIANRVLRPIGKALGLKVNWHSFRHTAVTNAEELMAGSDRQAWAGHATASMTAHYTHEDLARQGQSVQRMADQLVPAAPVAPPEPPPSKKSNVLEFRRKTG